MDPERWRQISAIYVEAAARSGAARAAFLADACAGDTALREHVQRFLDAPPTAGAFLDGPAAGARSGVIDATTSVLTGRRIGIYALQERIGAGGMGEVYRARDTRLGRDVAMKILPRAFNDDPDRLARFEREARVLAALNHPNIAIVHGVEDSDGIRGLVMELVDGETLAERVARGPAPIDEALRIAAQIVNALEAAHEQGIIHRDLKPANIKVRADGTVKVLDFGLAKAMEPAMGSSPSMSQSMTITTPAMMQAGMILGTAAYMAPEQALGKPVDKRADIWAFGAVLFELLTGRRPFDGEDTPEVLGAVVRLEPQWDALPPTVPARVSQTLRLCLRKDPKQRVGDIRDVRLALEGAFDTGGSQEAEGPVVPRPVLWRRVLPLACAALLTAIVVGFVAWSLWPSPAPRPVNRSQHVLPDGRDFTDTGRSVLATSPDGRRFVYAGTRGLYIRSMDTLEDQLISGSSAVSSNPTFSPDAAWLAFWSGGWLQKIAVVGGAPVPLTESTDPLGIRWDQDDTIIYSQSGSIRRVSADGGEPELLVEDVGGALAPQLLADGTTVLFETLNGQVAVRARESDAPTILFPGQRPTYLSTGHLVYVQDGVLSAVPFDAGTLQVTGGPVPLAEGVQGSPPQYAVSESGSLVYVTSGLDTGVAARMLALVDRGGVVEPLDLPPGAYSHPRMSPDGRQVALQVAGEDGSDIWVYALSGGTTFRRLTLEGSNIYPIWTPDGSRITYASDRDGRMSLYWQAADGSGVAERLTTPEEALAYLPDAWSPDGRTLALRGSGGGSQGSSLWTLSQDDGNTPRLFYDIAGNQMGAAFSPDGKWLAYLSGAFAQAQVYVQPFPSTGEIRQVSSHEDSAWPVWSRDGTELFYRRALPTGRYAIVAVGVTGDGGFKVGVARPLPIEGFSTALSIRNFDVTPDGQRFLMLFRADRTGDGEAVRPTITIVENWFEELRRRVPTP